MDLEGTHVAPGAEGGEHELVTEQDYDDFMRRYRERRRNIEPPQQRE